MYRNLVKPEKISTFAVDFKGNHEALCLDLVIRKREKFLSRQVGIMVPRFAWAVMIASSYKGNSHDLRIRDVVYQCHASFHYYLS